MSKKEDVNFDKLYDTVSKYMSEEELNYVKKSYSFAKKMHFGVKRLTGEDYIVHPVNVAYILTENKADMATICAALLHDILEDTDVTYEEMEKEFGHEITKLVDGVTKINKLNFSGEAEADLANHRKILVGLCEDVRVIIIKLADRLHNMRTLWVHSPKKQKIKAKETLDILTPIAHRLGMNHIKSELEDLSLRYYKPDVYFMVVEKLNKTKVEREKYVEEMIHEVSDLLNENHIKHEIKGRSKSIYSIYKKMDKGKKFSDIYDLLALRVFVDTEQDCYSALGIIHSRFRPLPKRFKDYIAMPKTNMYQSLHTTVFGVNENLFEIQIRTYKMDEVAENGIASHWSYKEKGSNVKASMQSEMEQKLQFFKALIDLQQEENDEEFMKSVEHDLLHNTIYVFTPKGDVVELPLGSTPIDFAYKVHTKVGDQMIGAIVNGNIVPLDYELQNNDIIKINTNKNSLGPSREWIQIAKTTSAKNKIKSFFNKLDKDEYIKNGQDLILKELKKLKINYNDFFTQNNIDLILDGTKLSTIEEVFTCVGNNKLAVVNVLNIILKEKQDSKEEKILKNVQNKEVIKTNIKKDIIIDGISDMKVNIASCCKPVPGDDIIGYITKGYGVTVHRTICPNVANLVERLIPVYWNDQIDKKYSTTLLIKTTGNPNLLLDIISKTSTNDINVQSIINIGKGKTVEMTLLVENEEKLKKFIHDIEMMSDVTLVERAIK